MYDIISIGDTTIDVFLGINEASVHCNIHHEECQLCFSYADKVPVESLQKIVAVGNAANNAVGSSRLGLKTALYTIVGKDMDGAACVAQLKKEGVAGKYISFDRKHGTNYSTVLRFKEERTILVYHEHRSYKLPKFDKAGWVYLTSMYDQGANKFHRDLLAYLRKSGAKLAFNPGTYQLKLGLEKLRTIFTATEVLFVNKEEAERLLGKSGEIPELLRDLHKAGPKIVVITDGQKGSYCFDGKTTYSLGILDLPVVERTGAGDSYATAFVAALAHGKDISEAMLWGSANAGSVVQYVGAQAGLLTRGKIQSMLKKYPEFKTKII